MIRAWSERLLKWGLNSARFAYVHNTESRHSNSSLCNNHNSYSSSAPYNSGGCVGGTHPCNTRSTVHSAASAAVSCFENDARLPGSAPGPLELNSAYDTFCIGILPTPLHPAVAMCLSIHVFLYTTLDIGPHGRPRNVVPRRCAPTSGRRESWMRYDVLGTLLWAGVPA